MAVNTGVRADGGSQGAQVCVQHQLAMYQAHASVNSAIRGPQTNSTSYMDDLQYLILYSTAVMNLRTYLFVCCELCNFDTIDTVIIIDYLLSSRALVCMTVVLDIMQFVSELRSSYCTEI